MLSEAGPLKAEELRERLGLHPRSARDFFDALVALRMLERDDERSVLEHTDDRPLPRPGEAVLYGWRAGDVERSPLPVLGITDRRLCGPGSRRAR